MRDQGLAPQPCPQGLGGGTVAEGGAPTCTEVHRGCGYGTAVLLGVLGAPTAKRLAPMMAELVPTLRRLEERRVTDETAAALVVMSAATIDRRLAPDRARLTLRGRSHTKPGSLLKDAIPIRPGPNGMTPCRA